MARSKPRNARCKLKSTPETASERSSRLAIRRKAQLARAPGYVVAHPFDPTKNVPRLPKRPFQKHRAGEDVVDARLRNPPSAEKRAADLAPLLADHEKIALIGINPKYLNTSPRKPTEASWKVRERLWADCLDVKITAAA